MPFQSISHDAMIICNNMCTSNTQSMFDDLKWKQTFSHYHYYHHHQSIPAGCGYTIKSEMYAMTNVWAVNISTWIQNDIYIKQYGRYLWDIGYKYTWFCRYVCEYSYVRRYNNVSIQAQLWNMLELMFATWMSVWRMARILFIRFWHDGITI